MAASAADASVRGPALRDNGLILGERFVSANVFCLDPPISLIDSHQPIAQPPVCPRPSYM
jgi:hypothetical protein